MVLIGVEESPHGHGQATAATWLWFDAMHEALGERSSIQPPSLVASCLVPNHGQAATEVSSSGCKGCKCPSSLAPTVRRSPCPPPAPSLPQKG